ncbi:MAG: CDP-alcohol phosphatidyltransferase family protein [Acidobacteriaceae bacterium]|jgi:phosphatidylglycerophosphate synthase|nr:CDP-alcohol phosphatidyltransferase family protein [Acidobacteriaceae bacterium]
MSRIHSAGSAIHVRAQTSLLANTERRLLVWIAGRLPRVVNADHLSALGLSAMAGAGFSFGLFRYTPRLAAAGVVMALSANWFGDSLDGTVARVRHQQRPRYGYYVDHVIDDAGTTTLFAGLALSPLMHPVMALAVLSAYLLVSSESYLATNATGVFRMSFLGWGPTELRLLLIAGAIKAASSPVVDIAALGRVRLFDVGGVAALGGLLIAFAVSAIRTTRALYIAERIPVDTPRAA